MALIATTAFASNVNAPTNNNFGVQAEQVMPLREKIHLEYHTYTREDLTRALNEIVTTDGNNYDVLYKTLLCESGFNAFPKSGDFGLANGIAQFHKDTWDRFNKIRGTDYDYNDPLDQLLMISWAFNNHLQGNWSCWVNLFQ